MLCYNPESAVSKYDSSAWFSTSKQHAQSVYARGFCGLLNASSLADNTSKGTTPEPWVIFRLLQGLPGTSSAASLFIADSCLDDHPSKSSFMSFSSFYDSLSPSS